MTTRKWVVAGVLAVVGLVASADRASAQYSFYNYGVSPYGANYNAYSYTPNYSYGITPYGGVGLYNNPVYSATHSGYYNNPYYGAGVYNSTYVAPNAYGPGGYQYRYWRYR